MTAAGALASGPKKSSRGRPRNSWTRWDQCWRNTDEARTSGMDLRRRKASCWLEEKGERVEAGMARHCARVRPVHWLVDNHVKRRLALGFFRLRATARAMNANGIPRRLARKIAWAVSMSTAAAYGVKAIWEGQQWLLDSFDRPTSVTGRTIADTFSTAKERTPGIQGPADIPHAPGVDSGLGELCLGSALLTISLLSMLCSCF